MPLETLTPLLLVLSAWFADEGAFVRAIDAVAGERYVEMTKALDDVRAAAADEAERARLDEDCVALAGLAPPLARDLLERVQSIDVSPPVSREIRVLLVRTLAREARARGTAADAVGARQRAAAAVDLAERGDDRSLEEWAREVRIEALLAAGPTPDDGAALERDIALLRGAIPAGEADASRRRERIDGWEALLAHRQGDDERAFRLLSAWDPSLCARPRALLELRLVVAVGLREVEVAAADAARLEAIVAETVDPADRARGHFALATWHRLRPPADGEDEGTRLRRAKEQYSRSAESAATLTERAAAIDWRGAVRSHLGEHDAAREDFERAAALYRQAGRDLLACGQHMRMAWNAFIADDTAESLRAIERFDAALATVSLHATGRLGEERNAHYLRARVALKDNDLDAATGSMIALFATDRRLTSPLGRRDLLRVNEPRAVICGSLLADLLQLAERLPAVRRRAFELAVACAEHASVLLLATLIAGPERPTFGATPGSLPPLPPGVAELRWARTAAGGGAVARYVMLARHGDRVEMQLLEPADRLDRDVEAFVARWMNPTSLADPASEYAAEAHALFRRLLGPATRWFEDGPTPRRLVIMADGILERLPIEALVTTDESHRDFAALRYLVRTTAVVHAPSLGVLAALDPPNERRAAVAVIDPIVRRADGRPLPSLRSTHVEREALSAARDVTVLRRESATLPNLRKTLLHDDIGWLHVASHSIVDPDYHDRAALQLTTNAQTPETLGVMAVIRLPLTPGTRVVLSACATASGVALPGEGVQALWRAFLVARAACVLSTLRPVDDRSAGHWIGEFHAAADALPLAEASRRASLRWIDGASRPTFPRGHAATDQAHPYLWAAWTCVGHDGGPLPLPPR